jgi:translation elongation factor EF-1alpha
VDRVAIQIDAIHAKRDKDDADWEDTPGAEAIAPGEWGRVEASISTRPVAIEPASVLPALSRFVLRAGNKAIAFGRCTKILG